MAANDRWVGQDGGIMGPVSQAVSLDSAKSDTLELTNTTRGISVNVDGNIVVVFAGDTATRKGSGTAVTIAVVAGVVYPFRISRINSTNTTATGIVGYY